MRKPYNEPAHSFSLCFLPVLLQVEFLPCLLEMMDSNLSGVINTFLYKADFAHGVLSWEQKPN